MHREAEGLASWLARQQGRSDETELRRLIASFLAEDIREQPLNPEDDADDLDDAGIFVEITVSKFLKTAGLPVPDELP